MMFGRLRKSKGFKFATYLTGMLQFAFPPYAIAQSGEPQIVLDGRTSTQLIINQNVTDVYTSTVLGNTGFNSFSVFNVYEGNEVNLYLPDGASALMNMVHDQQTVIDGYLNAYKDGKIGGDVYFLNPHGVIVSNTGVMNVGSVQLVTPTQDFMANMFGANGMISAPQVTLVKDSQVPLSPLGLISVRGSVNATGGAKISAEDVSVTGTIETGSQAVVAIDNLVNLGASAFDGGAMVDLSDVEAGISVFANDDVTLAGRLGADGATNQAAGAIDVRAGDDIFVQAGADLSADGQGANSDGGTVIVFADDAAVLGQGARLSADGGTSGDGGFVEFSAIRLVELAGGRLSAAAMDGTDGAVLIDPDDIVISADLLRDTSLNGGTGDADNNTSWNAGALTLQAANSITVNDNITISSRRVSAASDASAHRTANSVDDSGAIILQSDNISIGANAVITAKATGSFAAGDITLDGRIVEVQSGAEIDASNSGSGAAGAVLIDVDDRDNASITLSGATISGGNVTLDADASFTPGGVYDDPTAKANAEVILTNAAEIIASDNITITADATQNRHAYSGGVLVQFDARRASSAIDLRGATLTASDDITIGSASVIQTDMSPTGWSSLASLLPLNVSVAVTYSTSDILIDGASNITASGTLSVNADALTQSTILSQSNSAGASLVAAVSATENRATLEIADNASLSGADGVTLKTKGKTQVTAIADASAGSIASLSGAIAIGVGVVRDNTTTLIGDSASITSSAGDIAVLADSQSQTVFAARAANDDNFTATVQSKFNAGIDDTPELNQDFLGVNLASFLKSEVISQITEVTSQMDASEQSGGGIQLSGALTFSDVKNDTHAFVKGNGAQAPSLTASNGAIDIKARAITQAQGFASGRTDNGSVGGSAGIAIQLIENRLSAIAEGTDSANVNLTSDNLTVAALTQAYEDNVTDTNKYNIFASSGVGNDGDSDEVGIAGAIAVQISNINDVTAEIGDNVSVGVDDGVLVTASNNTEIKVKADGSKGAQAASDEFFAVLDDNTPSEQVVKTNSVSGKLGIGASFAFAITENDVIARVDGGALFTGTDNLTVSADQISTTQSEARSSGNGGIALVPVAAISVARNNALALIDSGDSALSLSDKTTISSSQDVTTSSVGNGAAATGGDSSLQVAVGLSAGISVSFDNNTARLSRNLTSSGGLEIAALTSHDIQSGAQSSAEKVDPELIEDADEPEETEENTADNASNNSTTDTVDSLLGTTNGQSGKVVNADAIKNKLNTNFSNVSGGDTPAGGPSSGGDDGKAVAIAGAFGVTYAESEAVAEISANVAVNTGSDNVTISSLKNTDMTSTGDASTGGSDYNVGGGVGLNIAKNNNTALVGEGVSVSASGLSVTAGMRAQLADDNSSDVTNVIAASATSGSGTGEVAIAGAVALNVVLENNATARIADNATLRLAGGDLVVESTATTSYDAASKATVGKEAGLFAGIDAALSGLQDITVWTSAISKNFTNLTTSAVNKA
ncbi:MAG: leukotoxin LktA family filamentous adhesin [Candidatus Puniceispirillaceae bacterium]